MRFQHADFLNTATSADEIRDVYFIKNSIFKNHFNFTFIITNAFF